MSNNKGEKERLKRLENMLTNEKVRNRLLDEKRKDQKEITRSLDDLLNRMKGSTQGEGQRGGLKKKIRKKSKRRKSKKKKTRRRRR